MNVGAETDAEKGESETRREARAIMTASGFRGEETMALLMSDAEVGVPLMIVWLGEAGMEDVFRMSVVMMWFEARADSMISLPVRPEPPRMRRCILPG